MSGLDRVTDRFHSDAALAQRTTREKLKFVLDRLNHLREGSRSDRVVQDAKNISEEVGEKGTFTKGQMSYIERMYEYVMKGMGLEHVPTHVDKKPRGLRYG